MQGAESRLRPASDAAACKAPLKHPVDDVFGVDLIPGLLRRDGQLVHEDLRTLSQRLGAECRRCRAQSPFEDVQAAAGDRLTSDAFQALRQDSVQAQVVHRQLRGTHRKRQSRVVDTLRLKLPLGLTDQLCIHRAGRT